MLNSFRWLTRTTHVIVSSHAIEITRASSPIRCVGAHSEDLFGVIRAFAAEGVYRIASSPPKDAGAPRQDSGVEAQLFGVTGPARPYRAASRSTTAPGSPACGSLPPGAGRESQGAVSECPKRPPTWIEGNPPTHCSY